MKKILKIIVYIVLVFLIIAVTIIAYLKYTHEPNWHVKENAIQSKTHPLAGFWKDNGCNDPWGWAIGPVDKDKYYISFCGPSGCFKEGTYRPNTSIVADSEYKVLDENTILFFSKGIWTKHIRCPKNMQYGTT